MRNELMVFHSCGHVTIEEVEDAVFEKFTKQPGHGPTLGMHFLVRGR